MSIANARDEIADILDDNPSLKPLLSDAVAAAYRLARRKAAIQANLVIERFPDVCPWTFEQSVAEDYWPD